MRTIRRRYRKTLTEDGHTVSYRDLSEIIRIRVEELMRLIMLELPRTDYSKFIPAGLVLTGGCANLPGIAELAQEIARVPVRVGEPVSLYGVSDELNDPAYATSVGLTSVEDEESECSYLGTSERHQTFTYPRCSVSSR